MRIVFVSRKNFEAMWKKTQPYERTSADIPTTNMILYSRNALVLVREEIEESAYEPDGELALWHFDQWLKNQ